MNVLLTLLAISAYAAAIFTGILLFRRLFRKRISPALKYALWFVLIARLLLPVTVEGGVRLFALPGRVETGAPAVVSKTAASPGFAADERTNKTAEAAAETPSTVRTGTSAAASRSALEMAASILWLTGAVFVGSWMAVSYAALRRGIRRDAAEPTERLRVLLAETKAELGVRGEIRLACAYVYGAPAMVFPNLLFLPLGALASMRDEERKNVFMHEMTHQKRGDPAVSVLLTALCARYWFNPVVWIAARLMRADMEAACDAAVTRRFSREEKEDYASLLLSLYALPVLGAPALSLSGRGVARQAEKRVRGVFDAKRSGVFVRIAALTLTFALLFGCFTTACQPQGGTSGHAADAKNPWISDVPTRVIAHIDREAEQFKKNLTFVVDADVTEPLDTEPVTVSVSRRTIDSAAFRSILQAVAPETAWTITEDEAGTGMSAAGERNGETYTAFGGTYSDGSSSLAVGPANVSMIREGFFTNDSEIERIYGKQVHTSIRTTAAEARPLADAVVRALGADGMMLQSAERACRFDTALMDDDTVLTRGWCFVYVPSCGGLPAFYRGDGMSYGGTFGTSYYGMPIEPVLSVYVDETGVSLVDCRNLLVVTGVNERTEPLLGYEDALESARKLLQNPYMNKDLSALQTITVTAVQLAASCVFGGSMSETAALGGAGESGSVVPVWDVICEIAITDGGMSREVFTLRFNATDGGAETWQERRSNPKKEPDCPFRFVDAAERTGYNRYK